MGSAGSHGPRPRPTRRRRPLAPPSARRRGRGGALGVRRCLGGVGGGLGGAGSVGRLPCRGLCSAVAAASVGAVVVTGGGLAVIAVDVRRRAEHRGDADRTDGRHGRQRHGQPAERRRRGGRRRRAARRSAAASTPSAAQTVSANCGASDCSSPSIHEMPDDPGDQPRRRRRRRSPSAVAPAARAATPGAAARQPGADLQQRRRRRTGATGWRARRGCRRRRRARTGADRGQCAHLRRADPSADPLVHQCDSLHSRHRQERSTPEM